MPFSLFTFFHSVWKYRAPIFLTLQILSKMWKTAQEFTRDYIKRLVRQKLKRQLAVVSFEIFLLIAAFLVDHRFQNKASACLASAVLWGITLYNLMELLMVTLPELKQVHRALKGKVGYSLKYFLRISLVNELLEWNFIFLGISIFLAVSYRTYFAASFSYLKPWIDLLH